MRNAGRTALTALALLLVAATTAVAGLVHQPLDDDGVITILLLGADQGPPRGGSPEQARADAFHLLFVSPDRQHATFLNIPRDAWVPVAGRGTTRINACLNRGPEACVETVEQLWGLEVDDWFLTSMLGMAKAFAEFGGVEIDVPHRLADGGPDITSTGPQRLKIDALTYARDRKNRPDGDFGRTAAQAELLAAAHRELVAGGASVADVVDAVRILRTHSLTSAAPARLLRYAFAAAGLPPGNVTSVNLPGRSGRAGEASVVFLTDGARGIVADAAADGRIGDG